MVRENATNAFVETTKIKREILSEIREITKSEKSIEIKTKLLTEYMTGKGLKHSYVGKTLFVISGGDYSTTYEFKL